MRVIAVDPDPVELVRLSESIRITTPPDTSVECFRDPLFVYQYADSHEVDALYAVADMKRISGFTMAKRLRRSNPRLEVYLIWGSDEYRSDAIRAGADGYLIKPVTPEALRRLSAELTEEYEEADTDAED